MSGTLASISRRRSLRSAHSFTLGSRRKAR
jgi:hypothetical protein